MDLPRYLMVWGTWGAYHHARFSAFRERCRVAGVDAQGLELFAESGTYGWTSRAAPGVTSLQLPGAETEFPGWLALRPALQLFRSLRPSVVFLPAYTGWSLALNLVARTVGARVVIMAETHEHTARPGRLRRLARSIAVRTAGAMLVGGSPHTRYFASLGASTNRIFEGYDAVDNEFFAQAAARARRTSPRVRGDRPGPVLSVARLVPKKRLDTVVEAYGIVRAQMGSERSPELRIIGSGPLRVALEHAAFAHQVPVGPLGLHFIETFDEEQVAQEMGRASCLVLASEREEWGLVVNEAMAARCPVIVSSAVGCAEDLVVPGTTGLSFDPGDAEVLAEHIVSLVTDEQAAIRLRDAAEQRISRWGCDRFACGALHAATAALSQRRQHNLSQASPL